MKFLGRILFLALYLTSVHAQEVIESTPLSVEDDGARKLIENKNSAPVIKVEEKEIIKIDSVELKPESLESVDVATKKEVKKTPKLALRKSKAPALKTAIAPPSKIMASEPAIIVTPVVVAPEKINSADGQLKLDVQAPDLKVKVDEIKIEDKRIDEAKVVILPEKNELKVMDVVSYDNTLKNYLQFSYGYMDSNYEKIDSNLDNGSNIISIAFVSDMTTQLQAGFAMELIADKSGQDIPDNVRSIQYRLFANYHAPIFGGVDWVAGFSFAVGNYSIEKRYINLAGAEVSQKIKDGSLIGFIPSAGIKFYLVGRTSLDIMAEFHQYFGKTQRYIGGLAVLPRFNFEF